MIYLSEQERAIVLDILRQHASAYDVYVFGSRATGKHLKPHSDLDLCLKNGPKLTLSQQATLENAFVEALIDFQVDIVEWETLSESFRRHMQGDLVKLEA